MMVEAFSNVPDLKVIEVSLRFVWRDVESFLGSCYSNLLVPKSGDLASNALESAGRTLFLAALRFSIHYRKNDVGWSHLYFQNHGRSTFDNSKYFFGEIPYEKILIIANKQPRTIFQISMQRISARHPCLISQNISLAQ
jgi:hypothetical protein